MGKGVLSCLRALWPRILFVIPVASVIYPPLYNRIDPTLLGIPFYYWYQLAAVLVGAVVVGVVYLLEQRQSA